jgi:hypothetical protein
MQCENVVEHCEACVGDPSLSQLLSNQSEYFTHWELYGVLCKENIMF